VATILLLALTVTLFAAIFAWVTAFPSPPPQNNNQFQASLRYTSNLTYVNGILITHLAGPSVAGTGQIYLASSTQPTAPEFATPYSVSSGLGGAKTWNLGQVWNLTFPLTEMPKAGGNITVYVVVSYQLLFSVILPGTTLAPPPTITSTAVSPATPTIGTIYTVYATITGSFTANSVFVNLAAVPGGPSSPQKMTLNGQGFWTYTVPSGATANGTFYGFVNASNGAGQQSTGLVVVTIYPSTGGSWTLTVGPGSGLVGSIATARGAGFAGSSSVVLTMDTVPIIPSGSTNATCTFAGSTITTTAAGTFTCQFAIPAAAGPGPGTLLASDTTYPTQTASASYTVTAWTITLSPTTHAASSAVTVTMTGAGFAATSTVLLYYNGAVITPASCTTGSISGTNVVTTFGAAFVCTWSLSGGTAGTYPFTAIDTTSGQVATAYFVRT